MLKTSHSQRSKVWKPIKLWDPFFKGGKLQVSKDGKQMICSYEGNIKIVDPSDTSRNVDFFDESAPYEAVSCFTVHPNWKEVVLASVKFSLSHWTVEGRVCHKTMKAHRMPILCMEYDASGTLVATGSADHTIRVWDVVKGYCTHSFSDHSNLIKSVIFYQPSLQAKQLFLLSTSEDNNVMIFDLFAQKKVAQFDEHASLPTQIAIACEGLILVTCGHDKVLNFYGFNSHVHLKTLPVMEELETLIAFPSRISKRLLLAADRKDLFPVESKDIAWGVFVTAGAKGLLRFYAIFVERAELSSIEVKPLFSLPISSLDYQHIHASSEEIAHLMGVSMIEYLSVSQEIVVITNDYNICSYTIDQLCECISRDLSTSNFALPLSSPISPISIKITPRQLLLGNHGDILDIVKIPSSTSISSSTSFNSLPTFQFAMVTNSHQLRIVNENFSCRICEGHQDIILSVDVSPDGQYLVTSSKDKTCRVWSVSAAECVAVGEGHTDAIGSVCISHSIATYQSRKAFVISGASDKILKKWPLPVHSFPSAEDLAQRHQHIPRVVQRLNASHSIRGHDKDINCVAVSPNDAIVASASQDKTIRLWNPDDLSALATLRGHKRGVWKVLFSSYEKILFSCSGDRTVKVWCVSEFTVLKTIEGNTASVLNVKLTHHDTQCITASADGLLRLFTIRSQECENVMEEHQDRVWAIETFHTGSADDPPNGENFLNFIISGGSDSKLVLWKDMTKEEEEQAIQQREEKLLLEQQLYNYLSRKQFLPALTLALQLKYSQKALTILQAIVEDVSSSSFQVKIGDGVGEGDAESIEFQQRGDQSLLTKVSDNFQRLFEREWSKSLDSYLLRLTEDHRKQLLLFLKDWNSNSRHCYLCQIILNAFLRLFPTAQLMKSSEWRESIAGFHAYTDRHYQRINRLLQASYYINYLIASVQGFLPLETLSRITHHQIATSNEENMTRQTKAPLAAETAEEEIAEITYMITNAPEAAGDDGGVEEKEEEEEEEVMAKGKRAALAVAGSKKTPNKRKRIASS